MSETCRVPGCGKPVHAAYVCEPCLDEMKTQLDELPILALALDARYLHQQRFATAGAVGHQVEHGIPYDEQASRVRRELSHYLLHWVLRVSADQAFVFLPHMTTKALANRLAGEITWFRAHERGAYAAGELMQLHARILRTVDRPADLIYLGRCAMGRNGSTCDEDLYAEWGAITITCRRCGRHHDVADRRTALIVEVKDQLATAAVISRGLSGLDMHVTAERIRQWKCRGRLVEHAKNPQGQPLYRVGDIVDLVLADNERSRT